MPAVRAHTAAIPATVDTFTDIWSTQWGRFSIAKPTTVAGDLLLTLFFQNTLDPTSAPSYPGPSYLSPAVGRIFSPYWGAEGAAWLWNYAYGADPGGASDHDYYITQPTHTTTPTNGPYPLALEVGLRICDGTEPGTIHWAIGGGGTGSISDIPWNANYDISAEAISLSDADWLDFLRYQTRPASRSEYYQSTITPLPKFLVSGGQQTYTITCPALPGRASGTMLSLVAINADIGDDDPVNIQNLTWAGTTVTVYDQFHALSGYNGLFVGVGDLLHVEGVAGVTNINGDWTVTTTGSVGAGPTFQNFAQFVVSAAPAGAWTAGTGFVARSMKLGTAPTGLTVVRNRSITVPGSATANRGKWWQYFGYKTWTATGSDNTASTFQLSVPWYLTRGKMFVTTITLASGPRARASASLIPNYYGRSSSDSSSVIVQGGRR